MKWYKSEREGMENNFRKACTTTLYTQSPHETRLGRLSISLKKYWCINNWFGFSLLWSACGFGHSASNVDQRRALLPVQASFFHITFVAFVSVLCEILYLLLRFVSLTDESSSNNDSNQVSPKRNTEKSEAKQSLSYVCAHWQHGSFWIIQQ